MNRTVPPNLGVGPWGEDKQRPRALPLDPAQGGALRIHDLFWPLATTAFNRCCG
jgi:hypothetical protein